MGQPPLQHPASNTLSGSFLSAVWSSERLPIVSDAENYIGVSESSLDALRIINHLGPLAQPRYLSQQAPEQLRSLDCA